MGLSGVGRSAKWLRGVDLNHRPLGYERPGARVSNGLCVTYGYPGVRKSTLWTPFWEPVGSGFWSFNPTVVGFGFRISNFQIGNWEVDPTNK